ncbi:hypothetical protein IW261DRAFT_1610500 [Armillaria novae-zelandiae]|uniref:Uncharacterized protein n=1 Tax=Armillaria novae-zelandiae TaxID=153914 RepID=A0AA39T9R4_9AGAR|nr:hypothetical protein IW261DRAFT_1610500 [Armillaria novae-zelandiae]
MMSLQHTLDVSRELARDTCWLEEVTGNVKALEAEVDKLNKKYSAAMKRVANQESNIAEHAAKRRRTNSISPSVCDGVKNTSISARVKRNIRHGVFVPPLVAEVLLPEEVTTSTSSSSVSGHV